MEKPISLIREASETDIADIVSVFRSSRAERMPYLPSLHSKEEDENYFKGLFQDHTIVVAGEERVIGFCVYKEGWIDHLYILPEFQGKGVGSMLLNKAKEANDTLQLWVFQKNKDAVKFYESKGFRLAEETDGSANEEKEPDARYVWVKEGTN
jgi:ribosomal protein S18 acetylase RimI-like enzyme